MDGGTNLLAYAMITLLGLLALGALTLAALLWRQPQTGHAEQARLTRTGAVRWLQIVLLTVAGVPLLGLSILALL